jgi:hypothetical protein
MEAKRITIGVDPGKHGAIVAILETRTQTVHTNVMPLVGTKRPTVDLTEVYAILSGYQELASGDKTPIHCYVEKQQPLPPKMGGGAANYARGYNLGLLEGVLVAISMSYTIVSPRRWQADMLADVEGTDTKARAVRVARRLFPSLDLRRSELAKKPDSGVVDALLIAEWGRRKS